MEERLLNKLILCENSESFNMFGIKHSFGLIYFTSENCCFYKRTQTNLQQDSVYGNSRCGIHEQRLTDCRTTDVKTVM